MATETKTFYPGAYEDSAGLEIKNGTNPVGKGSTNTTYAEILGTEYTNSGVTYCFWPFDVSTIPENAVIDSVSCVVKAARTSTQNNATPRIQLYSGDIAKGNEYVMSTITTDVKTFSLTPGTWTRDELSSIRLRTYVKSTSAINHGLRFYGADLIVAYTYNSEKFMLKTGGAWHDIARVFKKVNGIWVEQADLANVIEDGVRYKNGGEYIAPYNTITVTGTGNTSSCYLTINGEKVTTAGSHTVDSGSVVACYISTGYYGGSATIVVDGTTVQSSTGTYNYTVNNDCTINLSVTGSTWSQTIKITITSG